MEFGPRALCNSSIIYKTSDKTVNDWLNKRMSRTEFMPFAPVMTVEQAKKSFYNFSENDLTLKYMTSTMNANNDFVKRCPAVSHIDHTARPQIVKKNEDSFLWNLLTQWEQKTGEYSLINTSFNAHEEPIVNTYKHAIDALKNNIVDILLINDTFILKK